MALSELHPSKAPSSILCTELGSFIFWRLSQPLNASSGISLISEDWKITSVSFLQSLKACSV